MGRRLQCACPTRVTRWPSWLPNYRNRLKTCCGARFAWANMAVPACSRIWFLVKEVISDAISASRMTDSAAWVFSTLLARFALA